MNQLFKLCLVEGSHRKWSSFWKSSSKCSSSQILCRWSLEDSANQLVKDFINMCKSGVFHLTKFISNNKELLLLVCHYQNIRRMGVKDQDLCVDLPNEKALGICWNLREYIFSFELKLEAGTLDDKFSLWHTWICSIDCTWGKKNFTRTLQSGHSWTVKSVVL